MRNTEKVWPKHNIFLECGCCGGLHAKESDPHIDCRDDRYRFNFSELDTRYGENGWTELTLEDQDEIASESA